MTTTTEVRTTDHRTAGEPFRIVTAGALEIPGSTVPERRVHAQQNEEIDRIRRRLCHEPHGHADMYGGLLGAALNAGSQPGLSSTYPPVDHPAFRHPIFLLWAPIPRFGSPWVIGVTPGPDSHEFEDALQTLCTSEFVVSSRNNHIGVRLSGADAGTYDDRRDSLARRPHWRDRGARHRTNSSCFSAVGR